MDLHNLDVYLTIAFGSVCCILGTGFLLLQIPKNDSLQGYRIMRKAIAFAYIIVGLLQLLELLTSDQPAITHFSLLATIIVASFQSCLFTYALITLIDIHFTNRKRLLRELGIIVFLSLLCSVSYAWTSTNLFLVTLYTFCAYYFSQLIRYTYLFVKYYKRYEIQMDNYFSEQESYRMQWVIYAFFSALGIGILAFVIMFTPHWVNLLVVFIMTVYYFVFGIRFINYGFRFQYFERALTPVLETDLQQKGVISPISYNALESAIEHWVLAKKYIEPGITIDQLAACLCTNRTYLSTYINSEKGKTFKSWINELRIEEAKAILLNNPSLPIIEIAELIGISDKSNFGRLFTRIEGCSPQAWREKQLTEIRN